MTCFRRLSGALLGLLLMSGFASADTTFDWDFSSSGVAGLGISGAGTLTAAQVSGGEYVITGGSGTVIDSIYGTFSVIFATVPAAGDAPTLVNTDGGGANLQYDNLLYPGNPIGFQLDGYGIALLTTPLIDGASAIGVWDLPSGEFYNWSPEGYQSLAVPFNVFLDNTSPGFSSVPEPSSLALLGFGGIGLALRTIRRRFAPA